MDLHHPILGEFPEHRETARFLKTTNADFRKAFEEYHTLDDAICRIEEEVDQLAAKLWGLTDEEMAEIKRSLEEM